MVEIDETTIGMAFAVVGVVATLIWYALAWYGITTLRDIRDAVGGDGSAGNGG